ncbi:Pimeloyl-ACP methyl ester carboxylesterase [Sinomicrobium oceani]|uniref:Pimeloyl-ACP methyl ester carboxylesterase n=1 Tax=Sinomicrobium oceani TaxID=1150368 RepID=A0A1K1QH14_9FLAO|nr:alpha/beta hydrolase [Sinomicrobium oceani]SFW59037.1 Pimeloyl-ACP methyl ester carboxylesterase [Sinomicrobium oceani]
MKKKEFIKPLKINRKKDVVLLHGLFGELSNWESVKNHLLDNYNIYVPELPLFTSLTGKNNLRNLVLFLEDYIEQSGIHCPVLAGNSLGGHVALLYTLKHPEKVSSLVLTGSSGLYENTFGDTFPRVNDYRYIRNKVLDVFHRKEVADDLLVQKVFNTIQDKRKALAIIALARDAKRQNLRDRLRNIELPVLLIWGMQDIVTPISVAEEFYLSFPKASLHLINECGHVPMMEQPQAFNDILREFLENRTVKSA